MNNVCHSEDIVMINEKGSEKGVIFDMRVIVACGMWLCASVGRRKAYPYG